MTLMVRPATTKDSRFFYNLRTFEGYQQFFSSSSSIAFSDHERWFSSRLDGSFNLLYIASCPACDVGYVRFEPHPSFHSFEISFAIVHTQLGKGYSGPMISQSLHLLRCAIPVSETICVIANVFDDNHPSRKALRQCGFSKLYQNDNILEVARPIQSKKCDIHSYIILL